MILAWLLFLGVVGGLLSLDLLVFHKKEHRVTTKEAALWSIFWIGLACLFGLGVYWVNGTSAAAAYFAAYTVEKALSVDNLFVFLLIFKYFQVPAHLHHRVLFWGILGAVAIRFVFIVTGTWLITVFHPLLYVLGVLLIYTSIKLVSEHEGEANKGEELVQNNKLLTWINKHIPITADYVGSRFVVRKGGVWMGTPLLLVLIAVESTDFIFAMDSLPAVLAISQDSFIIFTSNVAAILGLRALYFLVESLIARLYYLKYGLAFALGFIGLKMILPDSLHYVFGVELEIPTVVSLITVLSAIGCAVCASLIREKTLKVVVKE